MDWAEGCKFKMTAYIVLVHFSDNIFKVKIIQALFLTGLLELINRNRSTSILVKVLKGCYKMFITLKLVEMDSGSYKLPIINRTTVVDISLQNITWFRRM